MNAFEGNEAETTTMIPVIETFMRAHHLTDVTVVTDAGMVSAGNQKAIEDAGLIPARTSPTGTSSPSPGPPDRKTNAGTR